jgi:tetratricopeptide (TPR) repeat protein
MSSPRALGAALLLLFAPSALAASSPADDQKARERYEAGDLALQLGHYDAAIQAFEDAYRLSHRVGILYNIGLAYRRAYSLQGKSEQLRRALEMYESFLRQAGAVPERAQIEGVTAQLRAQVAALDERERLAQLREAAGSPALQEAMKLYAAGKAPDALDALDRLLQKGGNPPGVLQDIYRVEAEISAQSGQPASADEAFEKLLALSPSFKPPADAAAAVRESFARASAYWEGKPSLRISPRVPPSAMPGAPLAIPVFVENDPLLMIARLAVHYRPGGQEAYSTVTRDGPGDLVISGINLPGTAEGYRVEYYLEATDRLGNVLASIGGPSVPLSFPVLSREEVARAAAAARPWYKNPWLWGGIGVGAAALAGGAALLVQRGPPPSNYGNVNLPK